MIGIVDINSMYASCERVFRPDLAGRPVGVLSNNDGCIIALSKELKDLGIKMGTPYFKIKDELDAAGVVLFSSNYELYGDMSRRVMAVLEGFTPELEIYSIDEAFLDLSGIDELGRHGRDIREAVLRWTGLPSCVGIGPTKTLAKLANRLAKKDRKSEGVRILTGPDRKALDSVAIDDIWGIGGRLATRMHAMGIETAWQLVCADPRTIRNNFNVVVERTVRELQGERCFSLNEEPPHPQHIMVSRAFSGRIRRFEDLNEAIVTYGARAAEKARQKSVYAEAVQVFVQTSPFAKDKPRYSNMATYNFAEARNDIGAINRAASIALKRIFRDGFEYQKAGVMLIGLVRSENRQPSFFGGHQDDKVERAMVALDSLNKKFGRNTLGVAAGGFRKTWAMSRNMLSPRYTTRWTDLRVVR